MDYDLFMRSTYDLFNGRDTEALLARMSSDVEWPNGMEGGYVRGHEAVRDYWTRQFKTIDPHVEATMVSVEPDGRVNVGVHQVVRSLQGELLSERDLEHVYTFRAGLVTHMEIRET